MIVIARKPIRRRVRLVAIRPPIKTLLANLKATKYGSREYYAALDVLYYDKRISTHELRELIDWIQNREKGKK